jgi:hypothetical protein
MVVPEKASFYLRHHISPMLAPGLFNLTKIPEIDTLTLCVGYYQMKKAPAIWSIRNKKFTLAIEVHEWIVVASQGLYSWPPGFLLLTDLKPSKVIFVII